MRKILFTIASCIAGTAIFIACSNEEEYTNNSNKETYDEYIYFNENMSIEIKSQKLKEAEHRIFDNIKIVDGKISLSHTSAIELCMEEEHFEDMKYLLENFKNPYEIIMPKTRSTTLSGGEYEKPDEIFNKTTTGLMIKAFLDSEFEEKCFDNYWYAKGDMTLTDSEWKGIKEHAELKYLVPDSCTTSNIVEVKISFYDNPEYNYALGVSAIYFIAEKAVGIYDKYDFNPQEDGVRDETAEAITRIVNKYGFIYGAKSYFITYKECE